jgi:hypothetical protein
MDDAYAIDLAKTEIREAYNTADPDRLLAVVDEGLIDFSDHGKQAIARVEKRRCGRISKLCSGSTMRTSCQSLSKSK